MATTKKTWLVRGAVGAVALIAVLAVGIPYVYTHFINKPKAKLSFENRDAEEAKAAGTAVDTVAAEAPAASASDDISGTWVIGAGSEIGYRVKESINGQATEGVGRSSSIEGSVVVAAGKLESAEFSVDIETLTSDSSRRDSQFTGRIMNAAEFPVASFVAASTPEVSLPADGSAVSASVDGTLTMHGVEKAVTVPIEMRMKDGAAQIQGSIPVTFADFGIDNPSIGPVKTGDTGLIEFLLTMTRQ